jgi:hypothetical protein
LILALDEEERAELVAQLAVSPLKVSVHGRYHMSRAVLTALIKALQTTAEQYDALVKQGVGEPPAEEEAAQ